MKMACAKSKGNRLRIGGEIDKNSTNLTIVAQGIEKLFDYFINLRISNFSNRSVGTPSNM